MPIIVGYKVQRLHSEKLGEYFAVVSINSRDTRKVVHKYKSKATADDVAGLLSGYRGQEL